MKKSEQLLVLRDAHLDVLGGSRTVEQAIAVVEANIKWINNNYAEVSLINTTFFAVRGFANVNRIDPPQVIDWLQNHRSH